MHLEGKVQGEPHTRYEQISEASMRKEVILGFLLWGVHFSSSAMAAATQGHKDLDMEGGRSNLRDWT